MSKLEQIMNSLNSYRKVGTKTSGPAININRSNPFYTRQGLNAMLYQWYTKLFHNQDKLNELKMRSNKFKQKSKDYIKDIKIRLNEASSEAKAANIADRSISSYTTAIYYTPNKVSYNKNETTAKVEGNKIYGVQESDTFLDDSKISSFKIPLESISIYHIDDSDKRNAIWVNQDGSPIVDSAINKIVKTKMEFYSRSPGKQDLIIDIDRLQYGSYNNIQLKTARAYIYTVYTSKDGNEYNKIVDKELTNSLNVSISDNNERYVRIYINISKEEFIKNAEYLYRVDIEKFFIATKKYSTPTTCVTGEIPINAIGEFIGIDTCDNYQNPNVEMNYAISINGGQFKDIKPLRKLNTRNPSIRAIIPINDYLDNNIVKLDDYTPTVDGNVFKSEINSELLETNLFKYYDCTNPIQEFGNYVVTTGINTEEKEVEFDDTYFVNGIPFVGKTKVPAGVNTFMFPSKNYSKLFDTYQAKIISVLDGTIKYKTEDGKELEISDPTYRVNPFYKIVSVCKYILGKEISQDNIKIKTTDDKYQIVVNNDIERIYVSARRKIANVDNVRFKIDMKTLDGYTIPYVSRILIKVA